MKKVIINFLKTPLRTISIVYGIALLLTFFALKLPNGIQELSFLLFDIRIPFNWNHGVVLLMTTVFGYRFFRNNRETTFFGNNSIKSIIFPLLLLIGYSIAGISNNYGINNHVWGLFFISMTLVYDIMEESFWRGYLNDLIKPKHIFIKYIITGFLWAFWHLLIFDNFNQWGGFHIFLLLSILVSFIIGFAVSRTNSILIAASIHALLIIQNIYVTIICLVTWSVVLITWNKKSWKRVVFDFRRVK